VIADSELQAHSAFVHKVFIPEEFANGRSSEFFKGTSDIERYIKKFEQAWWKVIRSFKDSVDWRSVPPSKCNGSPVESRACLDGYESAVSHLDKLIKVHGNTIIREFAGERIETEK
jgi:hypothetical protein